MFNLIVTTFRHMESEAASEIGSLLIELGDTDATINQTKVSGLLTVKTGLEPQEVIQRVTKIVQNEPWNVRYIQRLIPVDVVVNTNINDVRDEVAKLASRIGQRETFRITVEKRHSNLSSSDIIKNVADVVDRKVSLDVQDWLVLIEIIGEDTAVSVIRPDALFSAIKIKRES
ncbi:MAG: THUMP domain-containing protein [Nitrososphaerales archaeon]